MRTLIPTPDRSEVSKKERGIYDEWIEGFSAHDPDRSTYPSSEVFGAILNSPTVAVAVLGVGAAISEVEDPLPNWIHQFGDLVVSLELHRIRRVPEGGCELRVMFNHLPKAARSGVRLAAVRALLDDREADLTAEEAEYVLFIRDVVRGELTDRSFAAVEARLGKRMTIEFGLLMLFVVYMTRVEEFVGCRGATMAEVEERITELELGTVG